MPLTLGREGYSRKRGLRLTSRSPGPCVAISIAIIIPCDHMKFSGKY